MSNHPGVEDNDGGNPMIKIDTNLSPDDLADAVDTLFSLAGQKIASLRESWKPEDLN